MQDAVLPTPPSSNGSGVSWLLPSISASPLPDPCLAAAANATVNVSAACRDQLRQPMAASTSGAVELSVAAWMAIGLVISLLLVSSGVAAALIYKRRLQGRRKKLRASSLASSLSGDAITMQQVAGRSTESLEDPAHYDQDWFLHSLENALFAGRSYSSESSLQVVAAVPPPSGGHLAASAASSRLHARGLQVTAAAWARA